MSDDFDKDKLPSWLQGDEDDEPVEPVPLPDEDEDETPDWVSRLGSLTPAPKAPEDADAMAATDLPNWLFESDDEEPAEEATEVPSWLADLEAPDEPAPTPPQDSLGNRPSDDFLALGDELPATSDLEMSFNQWRAEQERERNGPDLEAEMPDLFSDVEESGAAAKPTGDLPDWYLGLEELDETEVPDWMAEEQAAPAPPPAAPSADDDEVPPWLAGLAAPNATPPPTTGDFDDDFFAAMGIEDSRPTPAVLDEPDMSWLDDDALTTASDRTRDDAKEDDFFGMLAAQPAVDLPPLEPLDDEPDALDFADDLPAATPASNADYDTSWLRDVMPQEPAKPATSDADMDDLFAAMDAAPQTPEAADDAFGIDWGSDEEDAVAPAPRTAQPASSLDDFDFPLDDEEDDPFLIFDSPQPRRDDVNAEPDWLDSLGDMDGASLLDAETPPAASGPSLLEAERPNLPATGELEQFLAGLDSDVIRLPQTGQLADQTDFDFDAPLAQDIGITPRSPVPGDELAAATPDFLDQLQVNVGAISAGAIVRQRKDRPLDALTDRLKDLHDRGEQLRPPAASTTDDDVIKRVLPNVQQTLAGAQIAAGLPSIPEALALTATERERVSLLQNLVRRETATPDDVDAAANGKRRKQAKATDHRPTTRRRYNFDRLIIAAALAAAVIAPFFIDELRIGALPPASFSAGGPGALAFDRVEALRPGALALVAVEYGPTGAAELDPMLDALVRHLLLVGAHPVLVGGNPVGLAHAANVVEAIGADAAFMERANRTTLRANRDYTVVRYLAGEMVGLRALAQNTADFMLTDIRGQATRLNIDSLRDFGLIAVVTDNGDDIRNYAEQIAPLASAPILLATGYGAGPLALPYAGTSGVGGLLVGYGDAYTYAAMIGEPVRIDAVAPSAPVGDDPNIAPETTAEAPRSGIGLPAALATVQARLMGGPDATVEATEDVTPTEDATSTPVASATATQVVPTQAADAAAQDTSTATSTVTPSVTPSSTPTATNTATATASVTPSPTLTHTPTHTPTATPTNTPTPTTTPSRTLTQTPQSAAGATLEPVTGRIVSSQESINVRRGPGTGFGIVATIASGAQVDVLGVNANRTWYLIRLPNSEAEGWVAIQLVYIAEGRDLVPVVDTESASKLQPMLRVLAQATDEPTPDDATAEATDTATEEATAEAAATTEPSATPAALLPVIGTSYSPLTPIETRDERWYATTLGIIASSTIIALGAAVNIARGIARREIAMNPEQIGLWAGLVLSLMVFSYILGDNVLYRLAIFVFIGLSAGYVAVVTVESVLLPWIYTTMLAEYAPLGTRILGVIPIMFGGLLLLKASPGWGQMGNLPLAFIIGVGAAVAIVGAVSGTMLPLVAATSNSVSVDPLNGFLMVLGVVCTLIYFQYLARRTPGGGVRVGLVSRVFGTVGHGFIIVTLAALYAAAILTSLTIFSERIAFFLSHMGGGS